MCNHKEECHHIHCEPPDHEPACTNGQCSCHHAGSLHILTISLLNTCPMSSEPMCQKIHKNCLPYYILQQADVYITVSATVIPLTTTLCVLMDSVRVFP